jgi:hypothetical protein
MHPNIFGFRSRLSLETSSEEEAFAGGHIDMTRLFLFLVFCVASWVNPVARAGDDAVYMVGLEVHTSRSVTASGRCQNPPDFRR